MTTKRMTKRHRRAPRRLGVMFRIERWIRPFLNRRDHKIVARYLIARDAARDVGDKLEQAVAKFLKDDDREALEEALETYKKDK